MFQALGKPVLVIWMYAGFSTHSASIAQILKMERTKRKGGQERTRKKSERTCSIHLAHLAQHKIIDRHTTSREELFVDERERELVRGVQSAGQRRLVDAHCSHLRRIYQSISSLFAQNHGMGGKNRERGEKTSD